MNYWANGVIVDLARNAIRLHVPDLSAADIDPERRDGITGVLDVGANGRLLGVEFGDVYVHVMDAPEGEDTYVRSAAVEVTVMSDSPVELSVPRHGSAYEITYPSGNQCWEMTSVNGKLIQVCATTVDAP